MKLLIFTQKVDKNDSALGFFHAWLWEFSKQCEKITVICLSKGVFDLPANVEVLSLGKETKVSRFNYLANLFKYLGQIDGEYDRVFVHMNPIYLAILGVYFRLKKIPVFLWYVHRSVDTKLRIATFFADKVFTSAKESFNLTTAKVVYLGHGIEEENLPFTPHLYNEGVLRIAHIGRITQIKNIDVLLEGVRILKKAGLNIELSLFGEAVTKDDKKYQSGLEDFISEKGLKNEVFWKGAFTHSKLAENLMESHISVNLTPKGGMDKVVLEAILMGLPTFVSNPAFQTVFGPYQNQFIFEFKNAENLVAKIQDFLRLSEKEKILIELDQKVRSEFSLKHLIEKIIKLMN